MIMESFKRGIEPYLRNLKNLRNEIGETPKLSSDDKEDKCLI